MTNDTCGSPCTWKVAYIAGGGVFDVAKLTLDEVGAEIDKTLNKLERLQHLYEAMASQEHRRVKKLVEEWNALKRQEREAEAEAKPGEP